MTYLELYEKATRQLKHGEITLGEYEEMIKPLNREVGICKDCAKGHKYKNIDECFCDYLQDDIDTDFYCKDFEKRGDENESIN